MSNILAIISFHNQSNSNGILSLKCNNINKINGNFIGTYIIRNESTSLVLNVYSINNSEKKYLLNGSNCYLHINSIIGNIYGFKNEEVIKMKFVGINDLIIAKKIILIPKTENDYKIIDETSSLVEEIFLDQINVLQNNQELILWIQENLYVTIIVKDIEADCLSKNNIYKLNNTTQVIVEDNTKIDEKKIIENKNNNYFNNNLLKINHKTLKDKVYRILNVHDLSYSTILISDDTISYGIYIVYVDHINGSFEGCLKNIPSAVPKGHCFIPKHFNTRFYSNIIINSVPLNRIKMINEITLICNQNIDIKLLKNKKKEIENYLNISSEYSVIVINYDGIYLSNNNEKLIINEEDSSKKMYGYFFTDSFPKIKIEKCTEKITKINENNDIIKYLNIGETLNEIHLFEYQKKVIEEILKYYQYINTSIGFSNIILLKGKDGSGKSTIVEELCKQLFIKKYIFSLKINCLDIRNQKPSKIIEEFQKKLSYLKTTYPSNLIVDNFDGITLKIMNDDDKIKSRIKLIRDLFYLMKKSNIPIIITSYSNDFISFIENEYIDLFLCEIDIPQLSQIDQSDILMKWCGDNQSSIYDEWKKITKNRDSFNLYDLKKLSQRIKIISYMNGREKCININDIEESLESLTQIDKIASKKINNIGNDIIWEDVIGMNEGKKILTEIIIWPTKYNEIYKNCPIRLGKNVILYGNSGVGKSYLVRGLIKKCNLYTIIIKGPELLSKYIGSSEENVRKTFEKARQNKPCLLIFEEFDGIAPRRGHDSTGVTDRVVNQLLTEMDGVESLDGVYIIATTSRIDLIDPALLRPGRLDYKIECKYPTKDEIVTFLKLYIPKMGMDFKSSINIDRNDKEIHNDLNSLGDCMINWSFGEIKGALTNTYFMALRKVQDSGTNNCNVQINEGEPLEITKNDLEKGIKESIPKRLLSSNYEYKSYLGEGINFKTGSRTTLA